jgi:hypothetical protein
MRLEIQRLDSGKRRIKRGSIPAGSATTARTSLFRVDPDRDLRSCRLSAGVTEHNADTRRFQKIAGMLN